MVPSYAPVGWTWGSSAGAAWPAPTPRRSSEIEGFTPGVPSIVLWTDARGRRHVATLAPEDVERSGSRLRVACVGGVDACRGFRGACLAAACLTHSSASLRLRDAKLSGPEIPGVVGVKVSMTEDSQTSESERHASTSTTMA